MHYDHDDRDRDHDHDYETDDTTRPVPYDHEPSFASHASFALTLLVNGWYGYRAVSAWASYRIGYTEIVLPLWSTVFVFAMFVITMGVWQRQALARDWAFGVVTMNTLASVMWMLKSGQMLWWVGIVLQLAAAIAYAAARDEFIDTASARTHRASQLLSWVALVASFWIVARGNSDGLGSERGRAAFAAEMQSRAPDGTTVRAVDRDVRMVNRADDEETVFANAEALRDRLAESGGRSHVWLLGFTRIVITNGTFSAILTPDGAIDAKRLAALHPVAR